jgi:CheY-like chemotaxis protein
MCQSRKPFVIVMADDDAEDCLLVRDAIGETGLLHGLYFVADGEELLDYLCCQGKYANGRAPRPDLILLDLNMPRKDGREALRHLKSDPQLRSIPVVVLTTSTAEDDVVYCYAMGASSFVSKPVTYRAWIDMVRHLSSYWFNLVRLPSTRP